MKKLISILSVVAVIAIIVLILLYNKKSAMKQTELATKVSTAVSVEMDVVKQMMINQSFSSNGVLEPIRELSFVSDVAGRVVAIYADEGMRLSAGQVMAQTDNELLKADFMASEASYNSLKADFERFSNANEQGGVTDQQLEAIRSQYIAAESRYISSKRRLADSKIKSPVSGTVTRRYIEVGTYLNPGAKLFDIIDESQFKVWCNVTERQILQLTKGQKVRIRCSAFPDESFTGTINYVGVKADRSLSYPVEINISGKDKKDLKSGMYVTAYFDFETAKKGILIPRSAVSGSVKNAKVYKVKNGIASGQDVIVGAMLDKNVEILTGLEAGDSIVVAGLINVSEGARVTDRD